DLLYANGGFTWDWQGLFTGPATFSNQDTPTSQNILGVGAWWDINSTIGIKFTPAFQMRLIVNNVFNKQPPFPALADGSGGNFANSTTTYFEGILGRSLQLSADYKLYSTAQVLACDDWKGAARRLSFSRHPICLTARNVTRIGASNGRRIVVIPKLPKLEPWVRIP